MKNKHEEKLGTVQCGADCLEVNGVLIDWDTLQALQRAEKGKVVRMEKGEDGICRLAA